MTRHQFLRVAACAGLAVLAVRPAAAQTGGHGHDAAAPSPATEGYVAANDRMHAAMAIEYTGDPDVDFARAMIAHHQGAIDMARVVLEHGSDPEIRQLAEEIVLAQEAEIAFLTAWLDRRGS